MTVPSLSFPPPSLHALLWSSDYFTIPLSWVHGDNIARFGDLRNDAALVVEREHTRILGAVQPTAYQGYYTSGDATSWNALIFEVDHRVGLEPYRYTSSQHLSPSQAIIGLLSYVADQPHLLDHLDFGMATSTAGVCLNCKRPAERLLLPIPGVHPVALFVHSNSLASPHAHPLHCTSNATPDSDRAAPACTICHDALAKPNTYGFAPHLRTGETRCILQERSFSTDLGGQ